METTRSQAKDKKDQIEREAQLAILKEDIRIIR